MRKPQVADSAAMKSRGEFLERVLSAIRYYGRVTVVFNRQRNSYLMFPPSKTPTPDAGELVGVYEKGVRLHQVAEDMKATRA